MLVILTGKCGAGKDTVKEELERRGFLPIISATTREPRPNERNGKDYFFLSEEEFLSQIRTKQIFEYREYESLTGKVYYGSKIMNLDPEKDYVKVLDPEGAGTYLEIYGANRCFVVEMIVPDSVRHKRAYKRQFPTNPQFYEPIDSEIFHSEKTEFEEEWGNRLEDDRQRFDNDGAKSRVNYFLDNNREISETVNDIKTALNAFKNRIHEFEETAHLHTQAVYPHLIVDITNNKAYAYTDSELTTSLPNSKEFAKIENLESLEHRAFFGKE